MEIIYFLRKHTVHTQKKILFKKDWILNRNHSFDLYIWKTGLHDRIFLVILIYKMKNTRSRGHPVSSDLL